MIDWTQAQDDHYYRARRLEEEARRTGTAKAWSEFAALKAEKGSYILACHGYFSAALSCEQAGDIDGAFRNYADAFQNARRAKSKELAVMIAYRHALVAERAERWQQSIEMYEALAAFAEELGNYFVAADACEHAAEMRIRSGESVAAYTKPIELWKKNAAWWREQGHEDDAAWSDRRIELYRKVFGVQAR